MKFYKKINLPAIPQELLNFDFYNDSDIIKTTTFIERFDYGFDHYLDGVFLNPPVYIVKQVNYLPLTQWLSQFFDLNFNVGLSIVKQKDLGRMIVHQDRNRTCVLNYVIESGGSHVTTNWFQEVDKPVQRGSKPRGLQSSTGRINYKDLTLLDSVESKVGEWYIIRTDVLHDVSNLEQDRVLLQIGFTDFNDLNGFNQLINLIK